MARPDAFLRAIADHPDDDGPRLVYADWLDERGDPRGEFIRTQCEAERLPEFDDRRADLEARADDLLAAHEADWLGPAAAVLADWEFRRGFVGRVEITPRDLRGWPDEVFRAAPASCARLRPEGDRSVTRLEPLLAGPVAGRLAGLDLRHYP